jgi:glycosyltransferase involved in cell wall biosynthesis
MSMSLFDRPGGTRRIAVVLAHDGGPTVATVLDKLSDKVDELVVVDDGSTDRTREVAAEHARDGRVRYLAQSREERSAARNRGIAASSAPLVAFLDADDRWLPEKLARQVAALARDGAAGLCYTAARFIDREGRPLAIRKPPRAVSGRIFPRLMRGNLIIVSSVVVRRACLEAVGPFERLATYGCEDWDLWLRLARRYPVLAVDEELTLYRRHGANTGWAQVLESALLVIDRWYADPETARLAGISRARVRALHYWVNAAWLAIERRSAGLPLALAALRESPPAAFSRPAAATLATLVLPRAAVGALRRLGV